MDDPPLPLFREMPYNLSEKRDKWSDIMVGRFKPIRKSRRFRRSIPSRGHKGHRLIRKRSAKAKVISLLDRIYAPEGRVDVDRITELFGMSKAKLAGTVGVRPDTLQRSARASSPKTQTRLVEMVEIVSRVADWAGGVLQAMAWYRAEPLPEFGGRTAESLVKDGKAVAVRDYLDGVALGGFA